MSAREEILRRVRAALRDQPAPGAVPRAYRREFPPPDLDLLADRLTDYRAVVHRCRAVADVVAELVTGTLVAPPGIDPGWLPSTVDVRRDDGLPAGVLATVDAVLTAAAVAIAETGTIVLDGSPDQGRRIVSLLPDLHICVLRADQVVASVPEALGRLNPRRPLTWISGPSATSDIELNRVEGVHGPRRLHVVLLEAAA
jgi:L-lactate dehydrogenase complex protein LldG